MDDIVKQAMAKWPNVPSCYGWLGLDGRGNWYMRDEGVQRLGEFASGVPGVKGSMLRHDKLIEFIQRNYACDASGQWFFQNGPQRVFVELEVTPWVWRVAPNASIVSHTGQSVQYLQGMVDEQGWVYLQTNLGFGLVHSQDVPCVANILQQGLWRFEDTTRAELPRRYGYVMSPKLQQQTP